MSRDHFVNIKQIYGGDYRDILYTGYYIIDGGDGNDIIAGINPNSILSLRYDIKRGYNVTFPNGFDNSSYVFK